MGLTNSLVTGYLLLVLYKQIPSCSSPTHLSSTKQSSVQVALSISSATVIMRHTIDSSAPLSPYMFMSQIPSILYTLQVFRVRQPPSASSHKGRKDQARGGRQSRLRASHHSPCQHAHHAQGKTRRMISSVTDPKTRFDLRNSLGGSSFCCFSEHKAILDTSRYSISFPAKIHSFFCYSRTQSRWKWNWWALHRTSPQLSRTMPSASS